MKHTLKVTLVIVFLFLLAQLTGLLVISKYVSIEDRLESKEIMKDGQLVIEEVTIKEETWSNLPYNIERPSVEEKSSYVAVIISILIATILALVLIKFEAKMLWKVWFFMSVWFTLSISFNAFAIQSFAVFIALVFTILKVFRDNVIVHNFTELFIYGGLAVIFVPILNVVSMLVLLLLISIYDMYAVWKSKHMIKMAKFQTKMKLFAGLMVPYGKKTAILGGGDIGFPLLFTGVIYRMQGLEALVISVTTSIALFLLMYYSKKNKYYPAMPFISIGCVVGYLITLVF
jgi:presenilin-like A22 family membrane protease